MSDREIEFNNINLYPSVTPELAGAIKYVIDEIPTIKAALDRSHGARWTNVTAFPSPVT